jgi:hypothetical protein
MPDKDTATKDTATKDTATDSAPHSGVPYTLERAVGRLATFTGPCAIASTEPERVLLPEPSGIDLGRVQLAGSLMSIYLYGMRLMFLPAVDRARELLDTEDLCVEGNDLRNALYCWPHEYDRVTPLQRATLVARVLGQRHPDVPDEVVDTEIQALLRNMFDLINSVCDPGLCRTDPTPATLDALDLARESVRFRLSRSVTEMVALQVRDLSGQLDTAVAVLTSLAGRLASPCRRDIGADVWASLDRLVGPQLRTDKIDVVSVAHAAQAWQEVFDWLANGTDASPVTSVEPSLCRAVSRLQPPRRTDGCASTNMASTAVP